MRYAILDSAYSPGDKQRGRGMAARYLRWELERHGLQEHPLADAECVLVTCLSAINIDYLRSVRRRWPGRIIIAGGAGSIAPYTLGLAADVVCVGDGQRFLATLFAEGLEAAKRLPNAWVHGDDRLVEIDNGFPWDFPPAQDVDGAYRIWCGRGCKKKCLFCATGWALKYAENPRPQAVIIQAQRLLAAGHRIGYLSNDLMQHSFYRQLPGTAHGSYSVDYLRRHGLPPARQVRLGVEGVSERLCALMGKPISDADLLDCTRWLMSNRRSVRWFLIPGLPGETERDWLELREIVQRFKASTSRGVLGLNFTAWIPQPSTPLALYPLQDDYWPRVEAFWRWFILEGGWSNRVQFKKPCAPKARLRQAMAYMGLDEPALRKGGSWGPNSRVMYPYRHVAQKAFDKVLRSINGQQVGATHDSGTN